MPLENDYFAQTMLTEMEFDTIRSLSPTFERRLRATGHTTLATSKPPTIQPLKVMQISLSEGQFGTNCNITLQVGPWP